MKFTKMLIHFYVNFIFTIFVVNSEIINEKVVRISDVSSQIVSIKTRIEFTYDKSAENILYQYEVDPTMQQFNYQVDFYNGMGNSVKYRKDDDHIFVLNVTKNLNNLTSILHIEEIFVGAIKSKMKFKEYSDPDTVLYIANEFFYSMYKTTSYKATFLVNHNFQVIRNDTLNEEFSQSFVIFKENIKPLTIETFNIEYEPNWALIKVKKLVKTWDVSHYGEIRVRDVIQLYNEGAKSIGHYKHHPRKILYTKLPLGAHKIKVYDILGLIYSYKLAENTIGDVTLNLKPRYPLLGGWKTNYILEYSLPTDIYISQYSSNSFHLHLQPFDYVPADTVVENFRTKVILPETAKYYQIDSGLRFIELLPNKFTITALSCYGRPTIIFKNNHVLKRQEERIVIRYKFSSIYLLRVPFKLAMYIFVAFVIIIVTVRIKEEFLAIYPEQDEIVEYLTNG